MSRVFQYFVPLFVVAALSSCTQADGSEGLASDNVNLDARLNGTWMNYQESWGSYIGWMFDNGRFESVEGIVTIFDDWNWDGPWDKGTYLARDGKLSITYTGLHGSWLNHEYQTLGARFESRWYSKEELDSKEKLNSLFINDSERSDLMIDQFLAAVGPFFDDGFLADYDVDDEQEQLALTYIVVVPAGPIETMKIFAKQHGPIHHHEWGEWTVVTPATATDDGLAKRTCKSDPTHTQFRTARWEEYFE